MHVCTNSHNGSVRCCLSLFRLSYMADKIDFVYCSLTTAGRKLERTVSSLNVPLQTSALLFSSLWWQTNVHVLRGYINLLLIWSRNGNQKTRLWWLLKFCGSFCRFQNLIQERYVLLLILCGLLPQQIKVQYSGKDIMFFALWLLVM